MERICYSCMKKINVGIDKCPVCGFSRKKYKHKLYHLFPLTLLNNRYLIGKVIGEGSFGIIYVGIDKRFGSKVAIKEYFPKNFAVRDVSSKGGNVVTASDGYSKEMYEKYMHRLYTESKILFKLKKIYGIVNVKEFFKENGTAYIIMEYIEGKNLKNYIEERGGKIIPSEALKLLRPVADSIKQLHRNNIFHRDISPNNIMVDDKGKVTLIDFGAARVSFEFEDNTFTRIVDGYHFASKIEKKQGVYIDIYDYCSTLYFVITGINPYENHKSKNKDKLKNPSELGVDIENTIESAIMKGMSVSYKERFQNMNELIMELFV